MHMQAHVPHGPFAACALQRALAGCFHSRRSPAQRLRKQLQSYGVDNLQAAVLAPRQHLAATNVAIRRGVSASAQIGLTGAWKKDKAASDPMGPACDAVALPWVLRKALNVLSTLEVQDGPDTFTTRIKAGGVMDVVERYPWSGEKVPHKRRDKRRGQHIGFVSRTADGSGCIHVEWDNPYGGVCDDVFAVSEGGRRLVQTTTMVMTDTRERVEYKCALSAA